MEPGSRTLFLPHVPAVADHDGLAGQRRRGERRQRHRQLTDVFHGGELAVHRVPEHHIADHVLFRDTQLTGLLLAELERSRRARPKGEPEEPAPWLDPQVIADLEQLGYVGND